MDLDLNSYIAPLIEKTESWGRLALINLPNFISAFVVFYIFLKISKQAKKYAHYLFSRNTDNLALTNLFATLVKVTVIFLGIFVALGILKLDKAVVSLLAGVGVLGLALGFAFQEIMTNFMSGIMIAFQKPFKTGDVIDTNAGMGVIDSINLRTTTIKKFDGNHIIIPNKDLFLSPITNYYYFPMRRVDIKCGISYDDDLEKVEQLALDTVKSMNISLKDQPIEFYYGEFGESSINFELKFWVHNADFLSAKHDAIKKIKKVFDENGITIPFPIRTLDFGMKGNSSLANQLSQNSK